MKLYSMEYKARCLGTKKKNFYNKLGTHPLEMKKNEKELGVLVDHI